MLVEKRPRTADELLASGLAVIDLAMEMSDSRFMLPLLSGGHDSMCACFVASQHTAFDGAVNHIDTGIGCQKNRDFVRELCREMEWDLRVFKSAETYEKYVSQNGFPGPGRHQFVYNRLKDRCVRQMMRYLHPEMVLLVTGCRYDESQRRMGHVETVKIGERSKKTGRVAERRRVWTAPCHDWTTDDQRTFIDAFALPRNPVKMSPLGVSGECFCGAFAAPNEINLIRHFAPDVAAEIDKLAEIAKANGKHCEWGTRPKWIDPNQLEFGFTGELCSSCDRKMLSGGYLVESACEVSG